MPIRSGDLKIKLGKEVEEGEGSGKDKGVVWRHQKVKRVAEGRG
jgi:hypothetical protein